MRKRTFLRRALLLAVFLLLTAGVVSFRLDWWEARPERLAGPFRFEDGFEGAATLDDLFPRDASRWHRPLE